MALGSPAMLALLAVAPAAMIGWWWLWRARRLHRLSVRAPIAGRRPGVIAARLALALTLILLAVAAARPQWGAGEQTLGRSEFSLVIALDVSQSMAAEDVESATGPPVSRFLAAKSEVRRLIDSRRGDRVGLVIFAGDAYLRFPLTRDHEAALQVLEALQPGEALVSPGSNIEAAITLAAATITRAAADNPRDGDGISATGAVALVSDGETHIGDAASAAANARAQGLQIFTIGVGSRSGAGIPLPPFGELKQDGNTGAAIITRLDAPQLREIAALGGGRYIELDAPGAMADLSADLAAYDRVRGFDVINTARAEQFQWFAGAAALMLVASIALRVFPGSTRALRRARVPALSSAVAALSDRSLQASIGALLAAVFVISACATGGIEQANRDGIERYNANEYEAALESWREAQRLALRTDAGIDPLLHLNAGRALHQLGQWARAETETLAALRAEDAAIRAMAWFHVGNHRWADDELLGARLAYIEALRESPALLDAKVNLELVNRLLAGPDEQTEEQLNASQEGHGQPAGGDDGSSADNGQRSSGEPGESGDPGEAEPDADGSDQSANSAPDALNGEASASAQELQGAPMTPSFAPEESLPARREAALEALQRALDELPLEEASLEQALAVLDALRAVPGERLAAGRLTAREQPMDW